MIQDLHPLRVELCLALRDLVDACVPRFDELFILIPAAEHAVAARGNGQLLQRFAALDLYRVDRRAAVDNKDHFTLASQQHENQDEQQQNRQAHQQILAVCLQPFAQTRQMERTTEKVETYLEGIYNTVIVRDIEDRQVRKESEPVRRKITDIALLKTIAKYLASVVGSPVSIRSITDYLISSGRKVSPNTVDDYVEALTESFIFYPAERFDIVGKQLLKVNKKYYIVDLGLRNHIVPRRNYDLGFSLENVVYFELLRRGYKVMIGKLGSTEVDFVAEKQGEYTYYQVTADMTAQETFEREMRPLTMIRDNYEKIILTADRLTAGNYNGIRVKNLMKWLVGKNE